MQKNWDEQELTTHKVEGLTYDTGCCWWGGVGPGGNKACAHLHMGVSENSVPLNPMVNDHYPY